MRAGSSSILAGTARTWLGALAILAAVAWFARHVPPGPGEPGLVRWLRLWPEHPVRTLLALALTLGAAGTRSAPRGERDRGARSPSAEAEAARVVKGPPSP